MRDIELGLFLHLSKQIEDLGRAFRIHRRALDRDDHVV
jgi:hypothetical protein